MNIPKWAIYVALAVITTGTVFWIIASQKTIANQKKANALLNSGKAQLALSKEDVAAIGKHIAAS